jgi:Glycosyl hydrolases family 39/Cep192 domain 4
MLWKPPSIRLGLGPGFGPAFVLVMLLVLCGWVNVAGGVPSPPGRQSQPASIAAPIPKTVFSMHMHSQALASMPWPEVGLGGIRLWDTHTSWSWLNPSRGVYDWSLLDQWLALAESHDVDVLYTFGVTPGWASAQPTQTCTYHPGACSPPADLRDWEEFVRALVVHANGRIKYWELWNEPNLDEFWSGDIQTLLRMTQRAYAVIKSVDPNAMVLTPAPTASPSNFATWLTSYFAAGGGDYADIVAFHGYLPYTVADPEYLKDVVDSINDAMSRNGQTGKPTWNTEASWGKADRLPDLDAQAAYVARAYILQWSLGVQRFYWYAWNNPLWGTLWDESTGDVLKPGIAFGETYKWLVGATLTSPCSVASDSTWTCSLSRPGGYDAEIIWNAATTAPATRPFVVDQRFAQYRDLDGNITPISRFTVPIGSKPILLEPFTDISLSRSVLKFDDVPVGLPSPPQTLVVTNAGTAPLLIAGTEITRDYSLIDGCGDSVAIGTGCELQVSFLPTFAGPRTGTLLIHDNSPGAPHAVSLTNNDRSTAILFSPSTLEFSGWVIGAAPASKKVTLTNVGDRVLTIGGPSITDASGSSFVISGNTCSSTLVPGGDCSITVTFSPKTTGVQTATLKALDTGANSDTTTTVPLSGTGWDFNLELRQDTPASVWRSRSGSYDVDVMPQGGFLGTVALAVSCNMSGVVSCTVTPSSIDITSTSPVTIHVQVNALGSSALGLLFGATAVLLLGMAWGFRLWPALALVLALVFLAGCAGVAGNNAQDALSIPAPIVVTGTSRGETRTLNLPVFLP